MTNIYIYIYMFYFSGFDFWPAWLRPYVIRLIHGETYRKAVYLMRTEHSFAVDPSFLIQPNEGIQIQQNLTISTWTPLDGDQFIGGSSMIIPFSKCGNGMFLDPFYIGKPTETGTYVHSLLWIAAQSSTSWWLLATWFNTLNAIMMVVTKWSSTMHRAILR